MYPALQRKDQDTDEIITVVDWFWFCFFSPIFLLAANHSAGLGTRKPRFKKTSPFHTMKEMKVRFFLFKKSLFLAFGNIRVHPYPGRRNAGEM